MNPSVNATTSVPQDLWSKWREPRLAQGTVAVNTVTRSSNEWFSRLGYDRLAKVTVAVICVAAVVLSAMFLGNMWCKPSLEGKIVGAFLVTGSSSISLMSCYLAVTSFFSTLRLSDTYERVISTCLTLTTVFSFLPIAVMGGGMVCIGGCSCPPEGGEAPCRPRISC